MHFLRKRLLLIVAALALIAGFAYAFWPRPVPVNIAMVTRGPLLVTVNEDGKTRIKERYTISTPIGGRLLRIDLHPGDTVEAGRTVLAVVEPSTPELLDARVRAQAEASVKAADAALGQASTNLERARTAHEFGQTDLNRTQKLYEMRVLSHSELDAAEQKERISAEEFRAAEFAMHVAEFELEQAKAALLHAEGRPTTEIPNGRLEIRSPVGGQVLRVFQESATTLAAGARLLEVGNPGDLEIEIDALSVDAVKIQPGAKVVLEHWGGDNPLLARVRIIEPAAFTKISALGVEEQRVNVIADFVDPPELRRGFGDAFLVDARIVIWEGDNVVKLPVGALFRHGEDWAAFTVDNGKARLRTLKLGYRNDLEAEVIEGLDPNAKVVVYPSDKIHDGVTVTVK